MAKLSRVLVLVAVALLPFVASADNPIAYRIGPGAQMTCSSSAPTHVSTRGTVWCNSSDSNKLYYTDPSGASSIIGLDAGLGWFNVKNYGAKGDGTTDDTTAWQTAAAACDAAKGGSIYVPTGTYIITGTVSIHTGCRFVGAGTSGTTIADGTTIKHKANNTNLFVWDGSVANAGTGGGIEHFFIAKAIGYSGGDAIYMTSTDDNHRPGEWSARDVIIGGEDNSAVWSRGLHVDGTANNTTGSRGIRSIRLDKFRVSACDGTGYPDQCVRLTQAVHVVATHFELDPVGGSGSAGMTIDGNFDQIYLYGAELNGDLVINQATDTTYNPNIEISGRVGGTFTNNSTKAIGHVRLAAIGTFSANASSLLGVDGIYNGQVISSAGNAIGSVPNTIYRDTTVTASVTTGETSGSTYSMPANTLNTNGQTLKLLAAFTHAANANSTTWKVYFGGSTVCNTTEATSGGMATARVEVTRTTSSTVTYTCLITSGSQGTTKQMGTIGSLNFAAALDTHISVTGATSNGDLSTNLFRVEYWP